MSFEGIVDRQTDRRTMDGQKTDKYQSQQLTLSTNSGELKTKGQTVVAHYQPPHQDLRCLQIQLFSSLVVKESSARDENS